MRLTQIYESLSDITRLRILHLLSQRPLCVGELQAVLQAAQVRISKHLAYLRKRGIVESKRHGQRMLYHLPQRLPRELELQLRCLRDCAQSDPAFEGDLQRLAALPAAAGRTPAPPPSPARPAALSGEPAFAPVWPTDGLVD